MVTIPSASQWLATAVGCPSLVICGQIDPRTLMPEYATDQTTVPIPAQDIFESIESIFEQQVQH